LHSLNHYIKLFCQKTACSFKANVLLQLRRGFEAVVAPTFEQALAGVDYKACLECFAMCPVGALVVPALQEENKAQK